jgi:hypothetical protein
MSLLSRLFANRRRDAGRKHLEARALSAAIIRRKFSALSSLFDYLCESNAAAGVGAA